MRDGLAGPGFRSGCWGCELKWTRLPRTGFAPVLTARNVPRRICEADPTKVHVTNMRNFVTDAEILAILETIAAIDPESVESTLVALTHTEGSIDGKDK